MPSADLLQGVGGGAPLLQPRVHVQHEVVEVSPPQLQGNR